jgi:hypothetical protein
MALRSGASGQQPLVNVLAGRVDQHLVRLVVVGEGGFVVLGKLFWHARGERGLWNLSPSRSCMWSVQIADMGIDP